MARFKQVKLREPDTEAGEATEENLVNMLIQYFNSVKNKHYKWYNADNRVVVKAALRRANGNADLIKKHILESDSDDLCIVVGNYTYAMPEQETLQPQQQIGNYMGLLEKAVVELIAKTNAEEIEHKIFDNIEEKVKDFVKSEYGIIERKIITVVDDKKTEMSGVLHEKFETVLKFVSNNEPVFLTGPAGSGKNVICQQVAKALGLNFYFSNAVTQEYKITGFTDAMGVFHESQFYKAFKNGGVFMLDEMDASIPEVLVILNAAIANRYFDFPAPIGYVEAHPDFRVIAAGNTFGLGADYEYVGRNQLDMASLDRFAMIKIDYSPSIENNVANGDVELVVFANDFREAARKAGIRALMSYRAIGRIAKMKQIMPVQEVLQTCLVKGMEKDDINMLINEMKFENQYKKALKQIVGGM